jgi:hypothetical protein
LGIGGACKNREPVRSLTSFTHHCSISISGQKEQHCIGRESKNLHNSLYSPSVEILGGVVKTHKPYGNVYGGANDNSALRKDECHAPVHDGKTRLDGPYSQDLHLLNHQDNLQAIDTVFDLCGTQFIYVFSGPWPCHQSAERSRFSSIHCRSFASPTVVASSD